MKSKVLPYGLQRVKFEGYLKKKGIDSDKVDLFALIDRKLSFNENKRLMNQHLGRNIYPNEVKGKLSSFELFSKAKEVNESRSNRSKFMDLRKRAKNTFYPDDISKKDYLKWRKNPSRYDIEGVDTQGSYW